MNEIYAAIYSRLSSELSVSIYDHVPQDLNSYPFVRLDQIQSITSDTDTENGFTATIQAVGYSRYRGGKEINDLCASVYNALHLYSMPDTSNYGVSIINETFRNIAVQDDGLTRNSVQQFTIIFEPLPL